MSIYVTDSLIPPIYSQKKRPSARPCLHPQGREGEVEREEDFSEQATLRASVLAFGRDNDSAESKSLSVWSILQTLLGNKDKLVQQSLLSRASHPVYSFILSFWSFQECSLFLFPSHFSVRLGKTRFDLILESWKTQCYCACYCSRFAFFVIASMHAEISLTFSAKEEPYQNDHKLPQWNHPKAFYAFDSEGMRFWWY